MSGSADLDLRYPIGLLFVVLGTILTAYGAMTAGNAVLYAPSAGLNINLIWGVVMILFGAAMSVLAYRADRHP